MVHKIITSLSLIACAAASNAQDFGVEVGASTLGAYVAPEVRFDPSISVRTPIYYGSVSRDTEYDGNDLTGELTSQSFAILADYYVANTGFRLSGGFGFGGYEVEGTVKNPSLDGYTYNGDFTANVAQKSDVSAIFALGYRHSFTKNWGASAEIGARFAKYELTTTGQEALPDPIRTQFDDEIAEINKDIADFGALPFVSLGISYRF